MNIPEGQYNFTKTEAEILKFWLDKKFYKPEYNPKTKQLDADDHSDTREKWTLVCPPPNAYDRPHMGNLSGYPYMDALGRYQRMNGKKVLLFPGKDHAGIEGEATYIKYFLEPLGKGKFDFTREEFYSQVMRSQSDFIPKILADEKLVGLSADFDRDLYTLDPKVVDEVLSTFIQMYKDGLIYKGVRIVNWDVKSQSAISDSQCERKEAQGKLYYIKYKLVGGDEYLTVATTRPETILGDTALVVNPKDERYTKFIGQKVIVPLTSREIPIITSGRIEIGFGTGILKLTPAHASEDYEIMLEWNAEVEKLERDNPTALDPIKHVKIEYLNIIDRYTKLTGPIPEKYKGLKVNPAREAIVADLKAEGIIEKEEDIMQNLLISERTGAVIEPIMSSQWFVDVSGFKKKLIDAVINEEVKIHPKSAEKKYISWVENLRDWAISRNLWWGYRMPVWYNGKMEERIGADGKVQILLIHNDKEEILEPANPDHMKVQLENPGDGWIQDDDILDTWFSSGQWPYMTLKTSNMMDRYPTNVLVSGYDLLIKWDLVMILFGIYKTGEVPFKNLYLTGLVKGNDGQKMSKSKKNGIPIDDVRDQFGIDSFRMNCFYQNKAGKAYSITPATLKNFRNFNNKIWNAAKYVMSTIDLNNLKPEDIDETILHRETYLNEKNKEMVQKILARHEKTTNYIEKFRFGYATEKLYHSFWHEFCDVYIEESKELIKIQEHAIVRETVSVLLFTLLTYLKLLHPFIPFITEDLFQILKEEGFTFSQAESLMYSEWKN